MKKYKLKKDFYDYFEKGDIVSDNGMYYEDDTNHSYCSVLDLIFKISKKEVLEEWFEEIKQTEIPKFKIGDKVVEESKFNNIGLDEYIVITSVAIYNKRYVYNLQYGKDGYCNSLKENEIRFATSEEIEKYFN